MTFAEIFDRLPADGWLSRPEAQLLWDYAARAIGPFVEVGAYMGRSSVLLGHAAREQWTRLYCVDPWGDDFHDTLSGDAIFARWLANVDGLPVAAFRMRVEEWKPIPAGLCYLDGEHTFQGTRWQLDKALQCRPQFILVHDCNDSGGGLAVKEACLERFGEWDERVERLAVWEMPG